MAATAVTRAHNRAIAKGTDPKAATCRAKLQRARSALNRQMDRELRLREGAENLLRATAKDGGGGDSVIGGGSGGRNKSKNRKHIRQTVALELSFLDSNVRLLADELAELNGSVDVYQHRDDDEDERDDYDDFDGRGRCDPGRARQRRRQRQMPMIAVPLKDTRPIDFGPPLERFISQHYGVDVSKTTPDGTDEGEGAISDDGDNCYGTGTVRRRTLSLREAIDELTQLRMDTQTPSRDADGVRLLLRYYRQLYYVDRRFFPPSSMTPTVTTTSRCSIHSQQHRQSQQHQLDHHQQNHHHQHHHNHHQRHNKPQHAVIGNDTSSSLSTPPPAISFEWYDSFGGPVPSCGQRTVRFEQACVLFNVAAVHTQMGAKHDRRCTSGGGRDDDERDDDASGAGKPPASQSSTSTGPDATDGAAAAARCFLRAAGAYRHIGDTFANAPARAADLRATGVLYAVMMAQANECVFEKLQWRLLSSVRHRCRHYRGREEHGRRMLPAGIEESLGGGDRRVRADRIAKTRRTSATAIIGGGGGGGMNDAIAHTPTWTELAREAAHVSRMYAEVVHNSCRPNDGAAHGGKENGGDLTAPSFVLPEVWVSVCRIKDRHYAALAYRYAACALLPYYRSADADPSEGRHHHRQPHNGNGRHRDRGVEATDADELLLELMAAAAAVGLEVPGDDDDDDDETTSAPVRQERRRKQIGKLLLEAAASTHDRAARAQRLCRQLRTKTDGNTTGGGLLAGVLARERQRTVRLLLLHRRDDDDDEYATADGDDDDDDDDRNRCCCQRRRRCVSSGGDRDRHECWSDDDGADATAAAVQSSGGGDQEEFAGVGMAGIPGLDVDRGVLIRPRTRFRLAAIAPDFTDTGDADDDDDAEVAVAEVEKGYGDDGDTATIKRHGGQRHDAADREERRVDLFAGLGPVAVFSARHRCTRPRWVKVARGDRHRSTGDIVAAVGGGHGDDGNDDDDGDEGLAVTSADPIQLVDRWFGFELRGYGGGTATAAPPATIGHVRSGSLAHHAGLRRGDIVVALKCAGDAGSRVVDVRWDTCRRVAELVVHQQQRRRHHQCPGGGVVAQLKVVTPITADGYATMDPSKIYCRRRTTATGMCPSIHSVPLPPPLTMPQCGSKQHRQKRRQNTSGANDTTDSTNKINTWSWNPFRLRRRSVPSNKC